MAGDLLLQTRFSRRLFAGLVIVLVAVGSVLTVKRFGLLQAQAPSHRQKGPVSAPIKVVEFSDFQCPACQTAVEPLKAIMNLYPGKIFLTFKHLPLKMHRWAKPAAHAAECAGEQEQFWAFHDILFERQKVWSKEENPPDVFFSYASEMGLNTSQFKSCIQNPMISATIATDIQEAAAQSVKATPTFFINGKRFVGARQLKAGGYAEIRRILGKI